MMQSIQELAKELGVTTEAVYKKLRHNRDKLPELSFEKQGTRRLYTEEACAAIRELFANQTTTITTEVDILKNNNNHLTTEVDRLTKALAEAEKRASDAEQRAALEQERAATFEKAAEKAQKQLDEIILQNGQLIQAVHAAQVLQAAAIKPTIIERIRARLAAPLKKEAENVPNKKAQP